MFASKAQAISSLHNLMRSAEDLERNERWLDLHAVAQQIAEVCINVVALQQLEPVQVQIRHIQAGLNQTQ